MHVDHPEKSLSGKGAHARVGGGRGRRSSGRRGLGGGQPRSPALGNHRAQGAEVVLAVRTSPLDEEAPQGGGLHVEDQPGSVEVRDLLDRLPDRLPEEDEDPGLVGQGHAPRP